LIVYADTSFLLSLYISDANTVIAAKKISRFDGSLLTTDFGEFEFTNALGWRVFRKLLLVGEQHKVLDSFSKDLEAGIIRIIPIPVAVFARARQIARKQTPVIGNRALDVLHVASALVLQADALFTFDDRQTKLASVLGLRVL
jgi:predicted nucleic acid-binding protein